MWPRDVLSECLDGAAVTGSNAFIYHVVVENRCDLKNWGAAGWAKSRSGQSSY